MLGGYGKGFLEPKASGRIARLAQIMREPATKRDYVWGFSVITVGAAAGIYLTGLV